MKFRVLVFELDVPQNFCFTHKQKENFRKLPNRVQGTPKCVNPSKTGNKKFLWKISSIDTEKRLKKNPH